jgi:membrane-bound lytic murein transglycosylase A
MRLPDTALEPTTWTELAGWTEEDHAAAYGALVKSCRAVVNRRSAPGETQPLLDALKHVCHRALAKPHLNERQARAFFEQNFRPVRVARLGETTGLLTGYYEPIVEGSRRRTAEFTVPMYRRPTDLVAVGRQRGEAFPNKGPVVRQFGRRKAVAYYDRAQIENGALAGRFLEICWLRDPIEAYAIHIQGSARVRLAEGGMLRLNYDAHNGHSYTPIGRILIERNIIPREQMSFERIRQWMEENPEEAVQVRRANKAFVFFRVASLADDEEAIGAQGIPLTAGRSIAVDSQLHVYGMPFWIEADLPLDSARETSPFRRLMVAQDTGSAIVGPARADLYFGAGEEAGRRAGRIRHPGRFVMLVPSALDPVAAGALMPMPRARPSDMIAVPRPPTKPRPGITGRVKVEAKTVGRRAARRKTRRWR